MTDLLEPTEREAADARKPNAAKAETINLKGQRIAITGGTTGIGRATAHLLASQGAKLFIIGRDLAALDDAIREGPGRIQGMAADLATNGGVDTFFRRASEQLGGLDVAILNAAVPAEGLSEMSINDIRYAIDVDFTSVIIGARAAAERMSKGDIVIVGSTSAHDLAPEFTVYAGAKAGLAGFAEALRRELGPKGIRVILVEPGFTASDLHYPDKCPPEQRKLVSEEKMLKAEDIAAAIQFALTQPRRAVVQSVSVVPINSEE
jgi:NAD(P)-dependent dehydrogenase (short-subunit alcohol dehydrogenase family)